MEKPTTLLANFADAGRLGRKMTAKKRQQIRKRQQRSGKKFYVKAADGRVHGTKHLKDSAGYTSDFAKALLRVWCTQWYANNPDSGNP